MAGLDTIWPDGSPYRGNTYNYFSFTQNVNGATVAHPGQYSSTVIADEVIGLVGAYGAERRATGKPWFLWVTPVAPHHGGPGESDDPAPYTEANGRQQRFMTPARPGWVKGRFDTAISKAPGTRAHGPSEADVTDKPENVAKFLETTPEENSRLRDVERQRAESLYAWDVEFGRIVQRLKDTGQFHKTLIMFTSDNGYYTGEHRQRLGKIKPHEPVIHVPLLVAGPEVPHGVRYAPVTTFDLTATILDIAGGTLRGMDGESKAGLLYGADRGWSYPMLTEGLLKDVHGRGVGLRLRPDRDRDPHRPLQVRPLRQRRPRALRPGDRPARAGVQDRRPGVRDGAARPRQAVVGVQGLPRRGLPRAAPRVVPAHQAAAGEPGGPRAPRGRPLLRRVRDPAGELPVGHVPHHVVHVAPRRPDRATPCLDCGGLCFRVCAERDVEHRQRPAPDRRFERRPVLPDLGAGEVPVCGAGSDARPAAFEDQVEAVQREAHGHRPHPRADVLCRIGVDAGLVPGAEHRGVLHHVCRHLAVQAQALGGRAEAAGVDRGPCRGERQPAAGAGRVVHRVRGYGRPRRAVL